MKMTIWRQFSSNHSASFTVVGEFESVWAAEQAEKKVRQILGRIQDWWEKCTPEKLREWADLPGPNPLTPIETELQKELKLDWPYRVNWFYTVPERDSVYRHERFLFVTNPHSYIYYGPQPFDAMLAQLGGKVDFDVDESRSHPNAILLLDVSCTLPQNKAEADLLFENFKEDFAACHKLGWGMREGTYTPNINIKFDTAYVGGVSDAESLHILEVERQQEQLFLRGLSIWDPWKTSDYGNQITVITDYLEGEGCTNITCSFRTLRNYRWKD